MPDTTWENLSDEGGIFVLHSLSAPGDVLAFFAHARAVDPDGNLASVPSTVDGLTRALERNDQLDVTPARRVEIGGLTGKVLDVRVSPTATARARPARTGAAGSPTTAKLSRAGS